MSISKNPDIARLNTKAFELETKDVPPHLYATLQEYLFRKLTLEEVAKTDKIVTDAWPGIEESQHHDLMARQMTNASMCGVIERATNSLVGFTRPLWGYDNLGRPEILSHMTAVKSKTRNSGLGEAMKWQLRKVALQLPEQPVEQLTVTFDPMQGRNTHVNLNKAGMVCGAAGGIFKQDAYIGLTGAQHVGNVADRYKARWYLNTPWVMAHLEENVERIPIEDARNFSQSVDIRYDRNTGFPVPKNIFEDHETDYVSLAVPIDWDRLLEVDSKGHKPFHMACKWRNAMRYVIEKYHPRYTTIGQVSDSANRINLHILRRDFDPYNPPKELIK